MDFPSYEKLIEDIPRDRSALALDGVGDPTYTGGIWSVRVGSATLELPTRLTMGEHLTVTNFEDMFGQVRAIYDLLPPEGQEIFAGLSAASGYFLGMAYGTAVMHEALSRFEFKDKPRKRGLLDSLTEWVERNGPKQ